MTLRVLSARTWGPRRGLSRLTRDGYPFPGWCPLSHLRSICLCYLSFLLEFSRFLEFPPRGCFSLRSFTLRYVYHLTTDGLVDQVAAAITQSTMKSIDQPMEVVPADSSGIVRTMTTGPGTYMGRTEFWVNNTGVDDEI